MNKLSIVNAAFIIALAFGAFLALSFGDYEKGEGNAVATRTSH